MAASSKFAINFILLLLLLLLRLFFFLLLLLLLLLEACLNFGLEKRDEGRGEKIRIEVSFELLFPTFFQDKFVVLKFTLCGGSTVLPPPPLFFSSLTENFKYFLTSIRRNSARELYTAVRGGGERVRSHEQTNIFFWLAGM